MKTALGRARSLGFPAVDIAATSGPISPAQLSRTGQRHLLRTLSDLGLRLGSLRGPTGGPGYGDAAAGERRLDTMRTILSLASALGVRVVSTTLGHPRRRPEDDAAAASRTMEALATLADDADRLGVTLAVETTGLESRVLGEWLARIHCPALGACCDTGAMLMQGEDPHRPPDALAGRIRLVRLRDAVAGSGAVTGHEVAMGEGDLDLAALLAGLREAGFAGDLVCSRTTGSAPAADLLRARAAIEPLLR